jgi:hypothetical protein
VRARRDQRPAGEPDREGAATDRDAADGLHGDAMTSLPQAAGRCRKSLQAWIGSR